MELNVFPFSFLDGYVNFKCRGTTFMTGKKPKLQTVTHEGTCSGGLPTTNFTRMLALEIIL